MPANIGKNVSTLCLSCCQMRMTMLDIFKQNMGDHLWHLYIIFSKQVYSSSKDFLFFRVCCLFLVSFLVAQCYRFASANSHWLQLHWVTFAVLQRQLAIYDVTHTTTDRHTHAHTHTCTRTATHNSQSVITCRPHTRRHLYWPHYNINLFVRFTLKKTQHSSDGEAPQVPLAKCPSILAAAAAAAAEQVRVS